MVVSCQKCRTRFQLDEARIPAKGVRVRCSKCKHAFFVAPPGSKDETLHDLAQQAAVSGRPSKPKPGPTHDLPPASRGEAEDDWQFNIDPPGAESGADLSQGTPPPAEITDSEPTESESVHGFFELDGLSDPGPEGGLEAPVGEPAAASAKAAKTAKFAPAKAAPPPEIAPEQEVTFEDLGSPETWDFGVDAPRGAAPAAAKAAPAPAVKAAKPKQAKKAAQPESAAPVERASRAASWSAPRGVAGALGAAGWLIALALFGFGLRGATLSPPAASSLEPIQVGALELAEVRVQHVENVYAGPLVVVSGELRNPGSQAASAGGAPRVRVTDERGDAVDGGSGWLGIGLSPADLRELDPAELAAAQARSARTLAERSFEPQDRVSVTALLGALPAAAASFEVEAAALGRLPAAPVPPPPPDAPPDIVPQGAAAQPDAPPPADGNAEAGAP